MIEVPAGLDGVVVDGTAVGEVRADEGSYRYRRHDAVDVARARPFEDVVALLVDGALPATSYASEAARAELAARRPQPPAVISALQAVVGSGPADALAVLRTSVSMLAAHHQMPSLLDPPRAARRNDLLTLVAGVPVLAAAAHRMSQGLAPLAPRADASHAADLLHLITGLDAPPDHVAALDQYLVVAADHGFNVSTFTARVVTSSGADAGAAFTAALAAFGGQLHGGAPARALEMLDEIGTPERAEAWVRDRLAGGHRIMGFGHRLYRTDDPRAVLLRGVVARTCGERGALALATEEAVSAVVNEQRPGRPLRVNLELYAGVLLESVGVPRSLITSTFAAARSAGWAAHVLEQAGANRLYRPVGRYDGPDEPDPVVPLERDA